MKTELNDGEEQDLHQHMQCMRKWKWLSHRRKLPSHEFEVAQFISKWSDNLSWKLFDQVTIYETVPVHQAICIMQNSHLRLKITIRKLQVMETSSGHVKQKAVGQLIESEGNQTKQFSGKTSWSCPRDLGSRKWRETVKCAAQS